MRKRIWIICICVLAFCLWLAWHRHGNQDATVRQTEQQTVASTQAPNRHDLPPEAALAAASRPPLQSSSTVSSIQPTNDTSPEIAPDWQVPIEFYGKVEDENDQPIAGATVQFHWTETPTEAMEEKPGETTAAISDGNGLFSLHGARGPSLSVDVSKDNYYTSRTNPWSFFYTLKGHFSPDALNPVIFHLRKKTEGASLIVADFPNFAHIVQLHHDGTPVELDLFNGKQTSAGSGQVKLELWRDVSAPNASVFDWKCQISVPNGGIVQCNDEFGFQAPESGYESSFVVDMPATNQNWQTELRTSFYIKTPNNDYGRVDFYLLAYNGVYTLHSAINPTGARNLESR